MHVRHFRQALSILFLIGLWRFATWAIGDPTLLPPPSDVAVKFVDMLTSLELIVHSLDSLRRVLVAFFFGSLAGIALGLVSSVYRPIWQLLEVPMDFVRSIPPIGFVPLTIAWFGVGELSKYLVIGYLTLIIVAISTVAGVNNVSRTRIRAAQCLGLTSWRLYWQVVLPSAASSIINALYLTLGLSFISLVGVEIIGSTSGLGFIIMDSRLLLQTDRMIVSIITIGVLGITTVAVFDLLLRLLGLKRFLREDSADGLQ